MKQVVQYAINLWFIRSNLVVTIGFAQIVLKQSSKMLIVNLSAPSAVKSLLCIHKDKLKHLLIGIQTRWFKYKLWDSRRRTELSRFQKRPEAMLLRHLRNCFSKGKYALIDHLRINAYSSLGKNSQPLIQMMSTKFSRKICQFIFQMNSKKGLKTWNKMGKICAIPYF